MPDPDPRIVYSDLCRSFTLDGVTVDVQIYRLKHDTTWTLEVVNEGRTATVWDDLFKSDTEAYAAFSATVQDEGMQTFLDDGDTETVH